MRQVKGYKNGYAENSRFYYVNRMLAYDGRIRVAVLYYHVCRHVTMTINNNDGYKSLAAAIVLRASKDAMSTDAELADDSVNWMISDECEFYCGALGIDHKCVMRYARNCMEDDRGTR